MIAENDGKFIIINGKVSDPDRLPDILKNTEYGEKGKQAGTTMVYEVIRLIRRVPLFYEDHYKRMRSSYDAAVEQSSSNLLSQSGDSHLVYHSGGNNMARGSFPAEQELFGMIQNLVDANGFQNCNVKVVAILDGGQCSLLGFISKSFYPTQEMVDNGVHTELYRRERENPNIKMVNREYKEQIASIKSQTGCYEVLLVDREGNLTEGSASNLFYVKGDVVFTAPGDKVLMGITRKHVLQACLDSGYPVREESLSSEQLDVIDGAFLSGTSPKVLPIATIGHRQYASAKNPVIVKIRDAYDRLLEEYIEKSGLVF